MLPKYSQLELKYFKWSGVRLVAENGMKRKAKDGCCWQHGSSGRWAHSYSNVCAHQLFIKLLGENGKSNICLYYLLFIISLPCINAHLLNGVVKVAVPVSVLLFPTTMNKEQQRLKMLEKKEEFYIEIIMFRRMTVQHNTPQHKTHHLKYLERATEEIV